MNKNLKSFRVKYGYTQKQIAEQLNITATTYNFKENRKNQFSLEEAKKIADLFNSTIEEIFFND